jgi:hypothetical protein
MVKLTINEMVGSEARKSHKDKKKKGELKGSIEFSFVFRLSLHSLG